MKRVMIAGDGSGCGKTTLTCALLGTMKKRGINVASFKCGPDYIDTMFHKTVIGVPSYNLDSYLMSENTIRYLLQKNSRDINIIEGVMGFYDGLNFASKGSSHEISQITNTPVILAVNCRGRGNSVLAEIKGFKEYLKNNIIGVIFNNTTEKMYSLLKGECKNIGIEPLGYMPFVGVAQIESRHLGLVTAAEIDDIKTKTELLATCAEKTIDIDKIIELSQCEDSEFTKPNISSTAEVKIAVAYDRAFCFYYEDNLNLLREMGAEILYFSPLNNEPVPECDGMILGGGYPELYAGELERNTISLNSVKEAIEKGTPCIAECGGFMYLSGSLNYEGRKYKMAGVIKAECEKKDKLVRFGYMEMTAQRDNILCKKGHKIKSREFHYFDCDNCGNGFKAVKNGMEWECVHTGNNFFAGFPHLHFYSDISLAENFIKECEKYRCMRLKK